MKRRCGTPLSGLAYAAACEQETFGKRACYYHAKLRDGLTTPARETLSAIERGTEGDRARSPVYAAAIRLARLGDAEAGRRAATLREYRTELETLLLLAAAGDIRGWEPPPEVSQNEHSATSPGRRRIRPSRG